MILTEKAKNSIDNLDTRLQLAIGLGFSETWIRELIKINKPNGPLTTLTAVNVITSKTGMTIAEIFEEENTAVATI